MADIVNFIDRGIPFMERMINFTEEDVNPGDILMIKQSIGYSATKLVVTAEESLTIRLNVYHNVHPVRVHGDTFHLNGYYNLANSTRYKSDSNPELTIEDGESLIFDGDITIDDIEIIDFTGGFKIGIGTGQIPSYNFLTFSLLTSSWKNGLSELEQDLTINDQTISPTFLFEGKNADSSTWTATVGEDFNTFFAAGTYGKETPFINDIDKAVNTDGATFWQATNSAFGDITTEDVVIEFVLKSPKDTGDYRVLNNFQTIPSSQGILTRINAGALYCIVYSAGSGSTILSSFIGFSEWMHVLIFIDRSGSGQIYINGVASGAAVDVSARTDLSTIEEWTIGANPTGSGRYLDDIAYVAMWKQDAWLDTHLQNNLAKERFLKVSGLYPEVAKGDPLPTVAARTSPAYLDKESISGTELLPSTDPTAGWVKDKVVTTVATGIYTPDGDQAYLMHEDDSINSLHYMYENLIPIVQNTYLEVSVDLKAINRDWFTVYFSNTAPWSDTRRVSFNVKDGAVGTAVGNILDSSITPLGNGWYRCKIRTQPDATGSGTISWMIAETDNDYVFTGLDQDSVYLANPRVRTYARRLFYVGDNWLRICQRFDANNNSITGYLSENAATNLALQSEDLSTTWESLGGSGISTDTGTAPNTEITADTITELGQQTFGASFTDNGIAQLDNSLTINSQTVSPTFVYEGKNATTATWTPTVGESLTGAGSGGTVDLDTPFISTDESVNPEGTRYWQESGTSFADVTTEDMVIEMIAKVSSTSGGAVEYLANKRAAPGWGIYEFNGEVVFFVNDGTDQASRVISHYGENTWYHYMIFIDRSGSMISYINGIPAAASTSLAAIDSISTTAKFTMTAASAGTLPFNGHLAYLAMWQKDAWLDTHLQADIAKERFYRVCGIYPEIARGTALPTTYTRASVATLDKEIIGSELLPSTNPTVGWTQTNIAIDIDATVTHPESATVYKLSEDDTLGAAHQTYETSVTATAGKTYQYNIDIKAANRTWARVNNSATTAKIAYFDVSNGVVGTTSNIHSAKIRPIGDDWYRCTFNIIAPAAGINFIISIAEADNDITFDGLDQTSLYIANPSVKEYTRQFFTVGDGWARVCQRSDKNGESVTGYLSEVASTNELTYSEEFDNAAWLKVFATVTANSTTAPDGNTTADTLVEDGTAASQHYVYTQFTQAASTTYVYSVFAKAANRNWIRLHAYSPTDTLGTAYFNLATGELGTGTEVDDFGIEDWGNGWFRCWIKDARTTAETGRLYLYTAEANGDIIFDGLSQDSLYVFGAQVQANVDYPTSYFKTTTAAAGRSVDLLYYKGDDGNVTNNQIGSIECNILIPDIGTSSKNLGFLGLSDGGAGADRMLFNGVPSGATVVPNFLGIAAGATEITTTGTTDLALNQKELIKYTWKTNSAKLYVDGASEGTEDTSCTPTDDLDRIHIGGQSSTGNETNGLISNIKIYDQVYEPNLDLTHGVRQAITLTDANQYIFSTWMRANTRSEGYLSVEDGIGAHAYFNLNDDTVISQSNTDNAGIEDWGDGLKRCWIVFTNNSGAGAYNFYVLASEGGSIAYDASASANAIDVWGVQVQDWHTLTSYIPTTTTTEARAVDLLYFKGDDGNLEDTIQGTIDFDFLLSPSVDTASNAFFFAFNINGTTTDGVYGYHPASTEGVYFYTRKTGELGTDLTIVSDVSDNVTHNFKGKWATNDSYLTLDGVTVGPDLTGHIASGINRLYIGSLNGSAALDGLIANIKIYNKKL